MSLTTLPHVRVEPGREAHEAHDVPDARPDSPDGAGAPPTPTGSRLATRGRSLWRGPTDDPTWARPALLGLLLATAVLYFINLTSNGYANAFYSAAAQAGSQSWEAFFFGSFDSSNAITVDKPPAALWIMALSVRLFGLNSFAILMPEVLMGVASVGILYAAVKRHFGAAAGLIAGAVLALTPVAVLMFRFNNPEALLVLLMTLGAWATVRAIDEGSPKWMILVGVFMGLGFLTKTLQVLLVVPGFAAAYLLAANTTLGKRLWHTTLAGLSMVVSAGWWIAIVELIPAANRPYIGGSQTNSFLELTFGYNGLGRINGEETGSVGGGGVGTGRWGATGLFRMFNSEVGGQISWLLPAALLFLVAGLIVRARMPRTDARRAAYVIWGGWLVVTMATFSFMAGIFHQYYTVALAPAGGALVGMGAVELWQRAHRSGDRGRLAALVTLAVAVMATSVWSFLLLSQTTSWLPWLRVFVLALGIAASIGILGVAVVHRSALPVIIGAAVVASLAGPTAYSVATVQTAYSGSIVTAGPSVAGAGMPGARGGRIGTGPTGGFGFPGAPGGTGQFGGTARGGAGGMGGLLDTTVANSAIVAALRENAESFTWVAAAVGSQNAAGLQLGAQLPVMSIGGFNGTDPSPTLAQFQDDVAAGKIHYFLAGSGVGGAFGGNSGTAGQISAWVSANFTPVTIGGQTFYDLTAPGGSSSTILGTN